MKLIKFKKLMCVSNEIQKHGAANLLLADVDEKRSWLCEKGTEKAIAILELECPTVITAVRIGNAHSAFVEVLVGNLGDPTDKYQTLIPRSMFMNCYDSKSGTNPDQVKFFYQKDFCTNVANKQWQVIQVVCTQPFNNQVPFGICFIRVTGLGDELEVVPEKKEEEKTELEEKKVEKETQPTVSEEMAKSVSSPSKLKPSSGKNRSSCPGDKRKQSRSEDFPDNRKNKNIGLEETPPKKRKIEKEHKRRGCSEEKTEERVKKKDGTTKMSQKKRDNRSSCGRHFSRLMEDVFFTISGFKNPERGDIRNQALKMGATYLTDWNSRCTHLICSYQNTPKYKQVKGKGKIVKKDWIEACYKDKKRYPWRRFALDHNETIVEESEEEILAKDDDTLDDDKDVSERPGPSSEEKRKPKKGGTDDPYVTDTDEEQGSVRDTTDYPMPHLPDFFTGKTFYIDQSLEDYSVIERYVVAYNGQITETMSEEVEFYITESAGTFLRIFRKKAPKMRAVRPRWIWEINSKSRWISPWKFMLSS